MFLRIGIRILLIHVVGGWLLALQMAMFLLFRAYLGPYLHRLGTLATCSQCKLFACVNAIFQTS
ncbi:hypothetical protein REPUB_Repub13aG0112800 [Reevesia pubescens]